jgi:hypothetical protein
MLDMVHRLGVEGCEAAESHLVSSEAAGTAT